MKFPVPSWHYSLPSYTGFPFRYSNLVSLTGEDGEGTPTLSADVSGQEHGTAGPHLRDFGATLDGKRPGVPSRASIEALWRLR